MPIVVRLSGRAGIGWCARAALVAAVVAGLFAMHTLPAMAAVPSMPSTMEHPKTSATAASSRLDGAHPAMGCSDHATCLAVLQDSQATSAPTLLAAEDLTIVANGLSFQQLTATYARAPPEVCLVGLCISRT